MSAVKTCKYLHVVIQLVALVLPASLNDDSGAEDESHQEDGVPQLLQVLLQTDRAESRYLFPFYNTLCNSENASGRSEKEKMQMIFSVSWLQNTFKLYLQCKLF